MTPRARELLLHPIVLAAIALLIANDHWLKAAHPGWLTGKLSDLAGMICFPIVAAALVQIAIAAPTRALVTACAIATAIVFALVKTIPVATEAFAWALGAVQWPFATASALVRGAAIGGIHEVGVRTDPSDLLALPAAAIPICLSRSARS